MGRNMDSISTSTGCWSRCQVQSSWIGSSTASSRGWAEAEVLMLTLGDVWPTLTNRTYHELTFDQLGTYRWLVVWNIFSIDWDSSFIIPIDEVIFFRGVGLNHQPDHESMREPNPSICWGPCDAAGALTKVILQLSTDDGRRHLFGSYMKERHTMEDMLIGRMVWWPWIRECIPQINQMTIEHWLQQCRRDDPLKEYSAVEVNTWKDLWVQYDFKI